MAIRISMLAVVLIGSCVLLADVASAITCNTIDTDDFKACKNGNFPQIRQSGNQDFCLTANVRGSALSLDKTCSYTMDGIVGAGFANLPAYPSCSAVNADPNATKLIEIYLEAMIADAGATSDITVLNLACCSNDECNTGLYLPYSGSSATMPLLSVINVVLLLAVALVGSRIFV
eukprot:gene10701-12402_t